MVACPFAGTTWLGALSGHRAVSGHRADANEGHEDESLRIVDLDAGRRTWFIGDVHGCIHELLTLLTACDLRNDDKLIFVGDLVAKGPESAAVMDVARKRGAEAVLGNHDLRWIGWWQSRSSGGESPPMPDGHAEAAECVPDDLRQWLMERPHILRLASYNTLAVHAGLLPGIPLQRQRVSEISTMRNITSDGAATRNIATGSPWALLWTGPEHVVFGHDARRGLQRHPFATGLDTGCVYGGRLTALCLPDHKLVSVPARHNYAKK